MTVGPRMVIDAHCHLGYAPQFYLPDASWPGMLRLMDRLGVETAVASHLALLAGFRKLGLAESLEAHRRSAGRILLYAVFDPREADGLALVERCVADAAFVGVKIHPSLHGCPGDDERYRPIWEYAARRGLPILTHSWCVSDYNPSQRLSQPGLFEKWVREFPGVPLVLGHAGGRYEGHVAAAALARAHENVYLDLAGDSYAPGLVEHFVDQVGDHRVLYGSDATWIDPRTQLGRIFEARISLAAKRNILRDNALKLFNIPAREEAST
jgi:predicted TIM-barrel fold metal-dependent hydrolase